MNRLTRKECSQYLGCSMSKLYSLEKSGALDNTYYTLGNRRIYITEKIDQWINKGGELINE